MFALLYQYLIEQGEVFIASVGRMQMIAQPATYDVANHQLLAPRHLVHVQTDAEAENLQPQLAFISRQLGIPEEESFEIYNEYCSHLQKELQKNRFVNWAGLGKLEKLQDGSLNFINDPQLDVYTPPVVANRVIRRGTAHSMMVGTTETTSTVMREFLEEKPILLSPSKWWIAASIVSIAAIVLIVLRKMQYL